MKGLLAIACGLFTVVVAPSPVQSFAPNFSVSSSTTILKASPINCADESSSVTTRRGAFTKVLTSGSMIAAGTLATALPAQARLDPVDKPQLLPSEKGLNVIQTEKFLTTGEAKRMDAKLAKLERDTGYRVRVLCQSYPMTPGLAIRDYWSVGKEDQKDDKYVVLVVDQFGGRGNVLNFNVGDGLRLAFPNSFWTQLQNKYGTTFFVRDNGVDTAVINAIDDIVQGLYDAARELS